MHCTLLYITVYSSGCQLLVSTSKNTAGNFYVSHTRISAQSRIVVLYFLLFNILIKIPSFQSILVIIFFSLYVSNPFLSLYSNSIIVNTLKIFKTDQKYTLVVHL